MTKKSNVYDSSFEGFDITDGSRVSNFDDAFGLDYDFAEKLSTPYHPKQLFDNDIGFTDEYMNSRTEHALAQNNPYAPEAISENYDDQVDEDDFIDSRNHDGFQNMMLVQELPKINIGKRVNIKIPKNVKLKRRFVRARKEALATGGNPISPQEARQYGRIGPTRNFGRASGDGDELY